MNEHKVPLRGPIVTPDEGTPTKEKLADGQYKDHWILSDEERTKGFIRPVRSKYIHRVPGPQYPLRDLTDEEKERFGSDYAKYEEYPKDSGKVARGRFWTQAQLDRVGKCGVVTSMPEKIAETYAAKPNFYGSTFCCGCHDYFPVGPRGEFYWAYGNEDELVGT